MCKNGYENNKNYANPVYLFIQARMPSGGSATTASPIFLGFAIALDRVVERLVHFRSRLVNTSLNLSLLHESGLIKICRHTFDFQAFPYVRLLRLIIAGR